MDINAYPKGCFASSKRHTNTKRTTFAMKLLSGTVSVVIGALGLSGQVSAFPGTNQFTEQNGVWTLGTDGNFQVTTGGVTRFLYIRLCRTHLSTPTIIALPGYGLILIRLLLLQAPYM